MTVSILVATPHAPFGELLRMSLEDSGQYRVRLVLSAREARAAAGHVTFQLAIIDSALTDEPFVSLCKDLLKNQDGLRLVIIPPENNPNHPSLGDLLPHGYLSRPFYLPDLINTVARLLTDRQSELRQNGDLPAAAALSISLPPWLQEPLTLRNYLQKELAGTQALAGMVGMVSAQPGRGMLRASAGQLEDSAAEELAAVVFRYWKCDEKTDLMRYIRLSADKRDYLVYATCLTGELVLILAYDTSAPLSIIRPQTKDMAQTLASLPPEGYQQPAPQEAAQPEVAQQEVVGAQQEVAQPEVVAQQEVVGAQQEVVAEDEPRTKPPAGGAPSDLEIAITATAEPAAPALPADAPLDTKDSLPAEPDPAGESKDTQEPPRSATEDVHTQPVDDALYASRSRSGFYPVESPDLFEEEPGPELDVINLAALLGSIPSPDPDGVSYGDNGWRPRSASAAIPTLPGGLNGWEHIEGPDAMKHTEAEEQPGPAEPASLPPADVVGSNEEFLALLQQPLEETPKESPPAEQAVPLGQAVPSEQIVPPLAQQETPASESPDTLMQDPHLRNRPVMTAPLKPQAEESPSADWAFAWAEADNLPEAVNLPEADEQIEEPPQLIQGSGPVFPVETPDWPREEPPQVDSTPTSSLPLAKEPPPDPLEDTRPRVVAAITQINQMEPVSPALALLNYTCVLVPRLPNHYLTGDLADKLSAWVAQICLAFGWRLEGIAVRPEYLQWSVQVAPAVSPGNLVRILRQRTSLHIFSAFPQFSGQNPSGDFWATGYLIVSGPQPPSAQLLRDYILQTRRRQGISK